LLVFLGVEALARIASTLSSAIDACSTERATDFDLLGSVEEFPRDGLPRPLREGVAEQQPQMK